MNRILLFTLFLLFNLNLFSQSQNDTSNYPYWINMMQDRSVNFYQTQRAFNVYWANRKIEKGSGWKAFKRWEWMAEKIIDSLGNFPDDEKQYSEFLKLVEISEKDNSKKMRTLAVPCKTQGDWKEFGPVYIPTNNTGQINGMGRVNSIALHPTDSNIYFVGGAAGGIWKTKDNGATWTVNKDSLPTLGVSSIVISPNNPDTMYFGSGDRDAGDAAGYGVFKSVNGGVNWTISNSGMGNLTVGKLVINPRNTAILYAATNGGIYKSTNSGATWSQQISGNFKDIVIKPDNPNVLYATRDGLFYRTLNGGGTWTNITTGLPTSGISRAVIDVNSKMKNLVYFWIANGSVNQGFYLSRDSGTTFRTQSTTPNLHDYSTNGSGSGGQAWYDKDMVTDPSSPAIIYVGGVNIFKSQDTGKTWTIAGYWVNEIHADQHELVSCPLTNRIFAGNDGGLYYTRTKGAPWTKVNSGLAIAQIYKMDASRTQKDILINGYQDNGTGNYNNGWYTTRGGDGMDCEIDQTDNNYSYGELYYGSVFRVYGVNTQATIADNGVNGINESGGWVTPITLKEGSGNTMYIGYKNIWRSDNIRSSPPSWTKISNSLGGTNSVNFTELESCIANNDILYASRSNGTFYRSDNVNTGTPTWNAITQPVSGTVSAIETDPKISTAVYISIGNRVYRSLNKGTSWSQINSNLSHNVGAILLDTSNKRKGIYVGTLGGGIWYTDTTMSSWKYYSKGLPNTVRVTDIEMYYENSKECNSNILYASTYNRGNWFSPAYFDGTKKPIARVEQHDTIVCKSTVVSIKDKSCNLPGRFQWSFSPNTVSYVSGTDSTSANIQVSFGAKGSYQYTYIVENCNGLDTITGNIEVGDSIKSHCVPNNTTNSVAGLGIFKVNFNGMTRSSAGRNPEGSYINLGCTKIVKVKRGKKYALKVTTGATYNEQVVAFIDFNNNGSFSDAGEMVYNPSAALQNHSDSIAIPLTATLNTLLRFRIRSDYNSIGTNPCNTLSYGQTEDYGIIIESDLIKPKYVVNDSTICQNEKVIFTDSTEGKGVSYTWDFGAGAIPATSTSKGPHNIQYTTSGYKKVKLEVDGKVYLKDSAVYVNATPNLGYELNKGSQSICENTSFNIIANDSNSTNPSYQWYKNNGIITDSIFSHFGKNNVNLNDSGIYKLTAINNGCRDSIVVQIKVNPLPKAKLFIDDTLQCFNNNNFTIIDSSSIAFGNLNRLLTFGDNSNSNVKNNTHQYSTINNFKVKLLSYSDFGCKDSLEKYTVVVENSVPNFTINNNSQCFKDNLFSFNNTTTLGYGTFTSTWNLGDGSSESAFNPSNKGYSTYNATYKVKLITNTIYNCKDSIEKTINLFASPTVNFNVNDSEQCLKSNLFNFVNTSSILNGTYSSEWNFGDNITSVLLSPNHNYINANNYSVKLKITSNNNCKDSLIKLMKVFHQPVVDFSINDSTQCLKGNSFSFANNSNIGAGTYTSNWEIVNHSKSSNTNYNLSFTKDSTYQVKLKIVSDKNCADSITKQAFVFENSQPDFTINNKSQCYNSNSYLFNNNSSLNTGTYNSTWHFGDGNTINNVNAGPINYTTFKDSFRVTLINTTNNGCVDSTVKYVNLLANPKANFNVNDSDQCIKGNNFIFNNTSNVLKGSISSQWNFGDNNVSVASNASHAYTNTGNNIQVKLLVIANVICKDSITKLMHVYPNPVANFTVNDSTQCFKNNQFDFTENGNISSGTYNVKWSFGDANISLLNNPSHNYASANNYKAKLVLTSNNNCKDSITKNMQVYIMPNANFSINKVQQCLDNNNFTMIDNTISPDFYNRVWKSDFVNIAGVNNTNSNVFVDSGKHQLSLEITTVNGCFDSVIKQVYVAPNPLFTVNGSIKYCIGSAINLNAVSNTINTYQWRMNGGAIFNGNPYTANANSVGNKNIVVTATSNLGCSTQLTLNNRVIVNPLPVPIIDTTVTMTSSGLKVEFNDITNIPVTYREWQFNNNIIRTDPSEYLIFNDSTTLITKLFLIDTNNCSNETEIKYFFTIPNRFYVPTSFSPNNDGFNDVFKLQGFLKVKQFSMKIINRWGEVIYQTNDPIMGWDGKMQGEKVEDGAYLYMIEVLDLSGRWHYRKGTVTILY